MELNIVGTWFGGLVGGAVIVIGVFQAVTGRAIFPFYSRRSWSQRQITSIGLGWVIFGTGFAMWSLVVGLLLLHQVRPPWWYVIGGSLVPVVVIAANFGVAAFLGREQPAK